MLPRVVATDLDGTLLRPDGTVAPRTRAALEAIQDAGAEVVVCTARPVRWTCGLAEAGGISGTAVCANGAVRWDLAAGALLDSVPVATATAEQVVERLAEVVPGGTWAVEWVDRFGREPGYEVRWPAEEDTIIDAVAALLSRAPVKLLLNRPRGGAPAQAVRARAAVQDLVELTWSEPTAELLEMSAAGVSKGSALAALCAARGIAPEEVIAFGDMPNDLSMLDWAGRGYAMANAHPAVVEAADEVVPDNAADGVAATLERLLAEAG